MLWASAGFDITTPDIATPEIPTTVVHAIARAEKTMIRVEAQTLTQSGFDWE
ncbi:hypothetical protein SynBIOSE41_01640 [Synechococcus sp. BIOS-E4-1]|nr:hypothetical protein SynBIOSE41_01640 [Synechococcus sp. BIOS-E4-1]